MSLNPRDALIALSILNSGDWDATFMAIKRNKMPSDEEIVSLTSNLSCKTLTYIDDDYPALLRNGCIRPPIVLYYYGNISMLQNPDKILTVVGSREPTAYATERTRALCREMVERDFILCSGLAYGIDTIAAEEGLRVPGHAIGVLGCGIDWMYPLENAPLKKKMAQTGLVLSEYPGKTPPDQKYFPKRNRILAGLGKATFAAEVGIHSGTSITVSYALQTDRDVGLLPFHANEPFHNNSYIKSGAAMIETVEDLVAMMEGRLRI